jgi:hypothetical protein
MDNNNNNKNKERKGELTIALIGVERNVGIVVMW